MGHWCRICGNNLPNERFSGKGHKTHICKKCSQKPKEEILHTDQEMEIGDFLRQSNISKKNISRLRKLAQSENEDIAEQASTVLEIALVKPGKKKRLRFLATKHRHLIEKLEKTGLIFECYN